MLVEAQFLQNMKCETVDGANTRVWLLDAEMLRNDRAKSHNTSWKQASSAEKKQCRADIVDERQLQR